MSENTIIKIRTGELVNAIAPVVISASRCTDIPTFYAKWFINRLHDGYCVWINPFNKKPLYVSFKNCKVIVFWTKNPRPLMPYLHELDERGIHYYFQYTLNDYDNEHFELNVEPLAKRIETFKDLSLLVGKERVIWRFDPLIVTPNLTPRQLLTKLWNLGNQLKGFTDKLVFSFIDVNAYCKVQNNLVRETNTFTKETVGNAELTHQQINEFVDGLVKCRNRWKEQGWNLQLTTCAEKVNLEIYEIEHNRCIDGELIERLWHDDKELVYFIHTGKLPEPSLFGNIIIPNINKNLKDKGQRNECGCIISKDIGMYNTCNHLCVYCYANTSKKTVRENIYKHSDDSESIM